MCDESIAIKGENTFTEKILADTNDLVKATSNIASSVLAKDKIIFNTISDSCEEKYEESAGIKYSFETNISIIRNNLSIINEFIKKI